MNAKMRIQEILGGRRTLGRRLSSEGDLIGAVRAGLPYAAFQSLADLLMLSADTVSSSIGLGKTTLARRKAQGQLSADESDRVLRLARVGAAAVDVLGDPAAASAWLRKRNRALGGATPLSLMDTDLGARQVERVLGRIEHGVFS